MEDIKVLVANGLHYADCLVRRVQRVVVASTGNVQEEMSVGDGGSSALRRVHLPERAREAA